MNEALLRRSVEIKQQQFVFGAFIRGDWHGQAV